MEPVEELPERIRRLRRVRRWNQEVLARRASLSASKISLIEKGRVQPSSHEVGTIAAAFGYSPQFLKASLGVSTTRPWLRAYADASRKEADARRETCTLAVEYIRSLRFRPLPDLLPPTRIDPADTQTLQEVVDEVRELAQLSDGAVVGNAIRAAERLGCVVLPFRSELGRHFGMSVRSDEVPVICVANSDAVPGDRQRFTVAHELGHLVLHAEQAPPRDAATARAMEKQADMFAAMFLGPSDGLVESLGVDGDRVTLEALLDVKADWGISVKALVRRFQELEVITEKRATLLYKQISKRGWNKAEPEPPPAESAQWFSKSIARRSKAESLADAAEELAAKVGGNGDDLFGFASWQILPDAAVIHLDSRRRATEAAVGT